MLILVYTGVALNETNDNEMTYDYIKQQSEKLDNDPNYKFPNWQTMLWVMEYRAAESILRIQTTRKGMKRQ